jgi:hypothetical protein
MQAKFVKTTGNGPKMAVVFKKDNGMHYQSPLVNLCAADQLRIAELTRFAGSGMVLR